MIPVFEIAWTVIFLLHFGLALLAILSLSNVASTMSVLACARWVLFCILVPVVGSICWFRIGRRNARARATEDSTQ